MENEAEEKKNIPAVDEGSAIMPQNTEQSPEPEPLIEPTNEPIHRPEHPHKKPRNSLKIALALFGALIIMGAGFATELVSSRGSLAKFSMAGVNIDESKSTEQLSSQIDQKLSGYQLTIVYPDGKTRSYAASELGVKFDAKMSVEQAKSQISKEPWYRKIQWWKKTSIQLEVKVDKTVLDSFIAKKATVTIKQAVNATLKIDKGKVKITDEQIGSGSTIKDAQTTLLNAARSADTKPIVLVKMTLDPVVTKSELQYLVDQIQQKLEAKITIDINNKKFYPDDITIGGWIEPIDTRSKQASLEFNSGKIAEYLDQIAGPYVHQPRDEISVKDSKGTTKVVVSGQNGYDIQGKDSIAAEIAKDLLGNGDINKKLVLNSSPYKKVTANNYPKWLIVDLTNKRMYAFEKDKLVKTFLVSAGAPGTPTVLGEYKIYAKIRKQDMKGANTDGSSYFQPDVEWVNYFHESYAIHGNYWRPLSYFGNINSSHGCVGVTNTDGEWIYNWAPIGTPVITHL